MLYILSEICYTYYGDSMKILTINNSSEQERFEYISNLYKCHNGDCENCGVCSIFKGKEPTKIYEDYIKGKKEFNEIKIY